jgi:hypothetical protein
MTITTTPTRAVFDSALKAGREAGQANSLDVGLNAPLLASIQGRVDKAWSEIAKTLDKAFIYGRTMIQGAIDASIAAINEILNTAGNEVRLVHEVVMEKIRSFMSRFLQGALGLLPATITAGGVTLSLKGMTFTQKLKLGGSIEASLTALASLVSEGELEVASDYSLSDSTNPVAA